MAATKGSKTLSTNQSVSAKNSRRCAASRRRTIATVRRAVSSWCRIFDFNIEFEPQSGDCASLASEVKRFLSHGLPSGVTEEARMSFQSIKKLLPPSCTCMEKSMLEKLIEGMLSPRDGSLPTGYLAFARKIAGVLFPVSWDTTYRSHVSSTGPSLSACLDATRSAGGATHIGIDHGQFLSKAFGTEEFEQVHQCEPLVVQSAGKPRPLTKYSADSLLIKPLHKSMYDRLSQMPWLLRGDVTPESLDRAGFKKGRGALVSGDYRSATDNLPLCVAEAILDVALENASRVPESVRLSARRLLRPQLVLAEMDQRGFLLNLEELGEVVAGQQMGSLLSFPLLCVQNYVAFRWAIQRFQPDGFPRFLPGDLPVLINGDDILFQVEDPRFFRAWVDTVHQVGLEVELSKTSFEDDFGSLNSTLVRWRGQYLRVCRTVRMGMLRSADFANSLSTNFANFTRGLGELSYNAAFQFFSWHRVRLIQSGRTLRELGFTGRLAWVVANKMQLQRVSLREVANLGGLPPAPTFHNFVLSHEDVEYLPEVVVGPDAAEVSRREMTSWKWRLRGKYKSKGSLLSYLVASSRPGLDWGRIALLEPKVTGSRPFGSYLTKFPAMEVEKRKYFAARPARVKCLPFFRSVERLPAYSEIFGDAFQSGPVSCEYALHRARLAGDKQALKSWQ